MAIQTEQAGSSAGPAGAPSIPRAYLIKVQRHAHGYNGTICQNAAAWQCGASENFRLQKCARGKPECFDLSLFVPGSPYFRRKLNYEGSEMIRDIRPGDLLFYWTYMVHNTRPPVNPTLVGIHVVDGVEIEDFFQPPTYTLFLRKDVSLHIDFMLPADQLIRRGVGEHLWTKQIDRGDVGWALDLVYRGLQEQSRVMRGRKTYDRQIETLENLLDELGQDEDSPLYDQLEEAGLLVVEKPLSPNPSPTRGEGSQESERPAVHVTAPLGGPLELAAHGVVRASPVDKLEEAATRQGLYYPRALLTRLHISVSTFPFVVLSGHSGTGKTGLSRVFAEAENAAVYYAAKVQPDWVSPSYLWGAYDYLAERFAPTEFALYVRQAGEEWDRARGERRDPHLFVFALDEMNLARVEYYLADVLSALEQPPDQRHVTLYSEALQNKGGFPSRLRLTPNIRLIGTINVDETTHTLSPKVLDRAHLIRLEHIDLSALRRLLVQSGMPGMDPVLLDFVFGHLEEIHRRMADDPVQQFGYRVARQIVEWVATATREPYRISREVALDAEISQKILPRMQIDPGSDAQMAMFDKLLSYFEGIESAGGGFDETMRWFRSRQTRLNQAEAVSGQQ